MIQKDIRYNSQDSKRYGQTDLTQKDIIYFVTQFLYLPKKFTPTYLYPGSRLIHSYLSNLLPPHYIHPPYFPHITYPHQMKIMNDWKSQKILYKDNILNFELLLSKDCLRHIEDDYYCLSEPLEVCESYVLENVNDQLAKDLGISEVDLEIKNFINQLNEYNELKEIGETLVHKLAERKGMTSRQMFKEMDYEDLSKSYDN